ncbi:MAG: hypothetical protein A2758_02745 [Candidatus Zambryskibacteria bacterium RIFCSPHIGHO2_01_FULL_49_18]|uniref:Uncharacterized protein n=1 Tax=Candidatus Zambryskibacteria bacterium RIFCSPHIGHO2_01_FULL_49_18 TaxID=1802740 RepID=A0A1G2T2J0_9BACT|nr:MAG: hypothetical protein A2758_02745 [Candidatus Zambryskibacteria bacterium RIFCSPHIGHO2_01_FULL_49_18]
MSAEKSSRRSFSLESFVSGNALLESDCIVTKSDKAVRPIFTDPRFEVITGEALKLFSHLVNRFPACAVVLELFSTGQKHFATWAIYHFDRYL